MGYFSSWPTPAFIFNDRETKIMNRSWLQNDEREKPRLN